MNGWLIASYQGSQPSKHRGLWARLLPNQDRGKVGRLTNDMGDFSPGYFQRPLPQAWEQTGCRTLRFIARPSRKLFESANLCQTI